MSNEYCCNSMEFFCEEGFNNVKAELKDTYFILRFKDSGYTEGTHCPWCGKRVGA